MAPPWLPRHRETSDATIFYFWFLCFWGPWAPNRPRKTCAKNFFLPSTPSEMAILGWNWYIMWHDISGFKTAQNSLYRIESGLFFGFEGFTFSCEKSLFDKKWRPKTWNRSKSKNHVYMHFYLFISVLEPEMTYNRMSRLRPKMAISEGVEGGKKFSRMFSWAHLVPRDPKTTKTNN